MIKVLIVEDSQTSLEFLVYLLELDKDIQVIGTAKDGKKAVELAKRKNPDVIVMDINLPKMNGFEATRMIMENNPVPNIIVSAAYDVKETATALHVLEAGAVASVNKPKGIGHPDHENLANQLLLTVKLMSEVKVVTRRRRQKAAKRRVSKAPKVEAAYSPRYVNAVVIGASTGGPPVLQAILSKFRKDFPVPILIVQHISQGFVVGLAEWLGQNTELPIHVASHGELPLPGHVYLAPDGFQMGLEKTGKISLSSGVSQDGNCPSVSHLFRSVADVCGKNVIGVLLTGMGKDGAMGMKLLKERDALTVAQDKESSLVHGMAGEAIKLKAAKYVLSIEDIAQRLNGLIK